jgi:soluble lytic murein transglycosylase-like protein
MVIEIALALVVSALILGLSSSRARAEIIAHVDDMGRRIYINTDDEELRVAVLRGGAAAGLQLMEQRRRSMPGIENHIARLSEEHEVDPRLVRAMIEVESAWNPAARSRKGAMGLMQLIPETGRRFGVGDFYDPEENISGGIRYLRYLLDRYDHDVRLALAAYNAGPTAVDENQGVPPFRETQDYLSRLENIYGSLGRGRSGWLRTNGRIYRVVRPDGRVVFENQ